MDQKYLTKREAAEYLRISVGTLDTMRARGDVPCIRLGGRILFSREALDATMAANAEHGKTGA